MNGLIWVSVGFVFGALVVGAGLSQRIDACVQEHRTGCVVQQTWTGTTVRPVSP